MKRRALLLLLASSCCAAMGAEGNPEQPGSTPGEATSLAIVNATSVAAISLSIDGKASYPMFPQGEQTGCAPPRSLAARYSAIDLASSRSGSSDLIKLTPGNRQVLVVMGDFSTDGPPDSFPQPGEVAEPGKSYPPNVHFRVFTYGMAPSEKPVRYRFVNAMPKTELKITLPSKDVSALKPGEDASFSGQPRGGAFSISAGTKIFNIPLARKSLLNRTIIFFLKDGAPAFTSIVEEVKVE